MVQNAFVYAARRIGILATHVQLTDGYLQGEQHMHLKHMHFLKGVNPMTNSRNCTCI